MQRILEHTKLIGILKRNKIDLQFVKKFNLQDLLNCCIRIEKNNLDNELYKEYIGIQKQLIVDSEFINYFVETSKNNIDFDRLENLCVELQDNNKKVSDYDLKILLQVLSNKRIIKNVFYDYLKYFSNGIKTLKDQNIVADNLSYFYNQKEVKMSELTEKERDLFFLEFISDYNLIPIHHIKKVCELLVQDNELKNIILFLYSHNLKLPLNLREYELISKNSKSIFKYLLKFVELLDNENMYQLLLRWIENGCTTYDLQILENKLQGMEKNEISKIVCNRSSYINLIFGNKLNGLPLEDIYGEKEKILIYAISNNKKRFLQLIQENTQEFLSISQNSILFYEDFYQKYVNLNTLTLKNLTDLKSMCGHNMRINLLNDNIYTFEEIKLLFDLSGQYLSLYNYLLDLRVDERMLIIKQLTKRNLLNNGISDEELQKLAEMFKIQHLYRWMEKDFAHIKGIIQENVITILICYDKIKKFIPQIHNQIELKYVIRNLDKIQEYSNLDILKNNIENIDNYWKKLVDKMDFSKQFIQDNKSNIKKFLLNNGSELALTYCDSRYSQDLTTFKKIVKAELMGQFKKLKYFEDDLHKEIDFDLGKAQIFEWTSNNRMLLDGGIQVKEYDDFYSTMILGESPRHTCLSYEGGAYNQCLMACFDSNKKILYAKVDDKIVARAMVRLTKGTYNCQCKKKKLTFVDLENVNSTEDSKIPKDEYLTIFLERPYISGISPEQENKIKKLFISLLEEKALNMNALLVLSNEYSDVVNQNYIVTKYHIYISKSKAGSQYLDSLCGENSITDEGQYKSNTFMIWQNQKTKMERNDKNGYYKSIL